MMKKIILFLVTIIGISLLLSCSDEDPHATAEVSFQGYLVDLDFSDKLNEEEATPDSDEGANVSAQKTEDGYDYTVAIQDAFSELNLIGQNSVITETVTVNVNDITTAQIICYQQAKPKLDSRINAITMLDVLSALYKTDMENMNKLGYYSLNDIPLKIIKAKINYYTAASPDNYFSYDLNLVL